MQVALGLALVALVATDNVPFADGERRPALAPDGRPLRLGGGLAPAPDPGRARPAPGGLGGLAPAGRGLRDLLPDGRFQPVPEGFAT